MPPTKKKNSQPKKPPKKPRSSATKKKKAEDKPWTSSIKFEIKGTPENSRSNTPSHDGKSRSGTMTSRDFIRQVLEFDKASESELDSDEGDDDMDNSSDIELKIAINDSLADSKQLAASDDAGLSDSDTEDDSTLNDTTASADIDMEATNDSNASFPSADPLSFSVYAPMPEFQPDDVPPLDLPPSSDDLLVEKGHVLKAAGIYEVLRIYSQIIRLSPFIFEEFLAAIASTTSFEYNPLLHEVHSCLMKTLLREEDNNQTSYGPVDLKDSMNSVFFFNDAMTYPYVIREYLRSDVDKEFRIALELISDPDYPNVTVDKKLSVLETLCNLILSSNSIREELSADGFIKYEDHCRVCQK